MFLRFVRQGSLYAEAVQLQRFDEAGTLLAQLGSDKGDVGEQTLVELRRTGGAETGVRSQPT